MWVKHHLQDVRLTYWSNTDAYQCTIVKELKISISLYVRHIRVMCSYSPICLSSNCLLEPEKSLSGWLVSASRNLLNTFHEKKICHFKNLNRNVCQTHEFKAPLEQVIPRAAVPPSQAVAKTRQVTLTWEETLPSAERIYASNYRDKRVSG